MTVVVAFSCNLDWSNLWNRVGTNRVETNRVGTNRVGTNRVGTNRVGTKQPNIGEKIDVQRHLD
jgi:hypothetical protein